MLCVPRRLAAVLGVNMDEALSYFDEFLDPGWTERGVTPLEVRKLCERQGRCFYYLWSTDARCFRASREALCPPGRSDDQLGGA